MTAGWTPEEWARIERIAREERRTREMLRVLQSASALARKAWRTTADGAALELRQWSAEAVRRPLARAGE